MNGKQRQIYMNKETEKKALQVCSLLDISMSALIRIALEEYIAKLKKEAVSIK